MSNKTYTADTDVELNFENWYPELRVGRGWGGGGAYSRNWPHSHTSSSWNLVPSQSISKQ